GARALSVTLVDRCALAAARSRWSSKPAHGGLRYLAQADVAIAWESAVERGRLMNTIAPHLIRPLPMIFPLHPGIGRIEAAVTSTGFHAGDVLRRLARTPKDLLPRPRRVSAAAVLPLPAPRRCRSRACRGCAGWRRPRPAPASSPAPPCAGWHPPRRPPSPAPVESRPPRSAASPRRRPARVCAADCSAGTVSSSTT